LDSNKNILKKPVQSICDIIGLKNDHNDTQINNNDPKSKSQQIEIDFSAFDKEMNEDNALIDTFEMLNISLPTTSNSKLQEKPQNGENVKQDKKANAQDLFAGMTFDNNKASNDISDLAALIESTPTKPKSTAKPITKSTATVQSNDFGFDVVDDSVQTSEQTKKQKNISKFSNSLYYKYSNLFISNDCNDFSVSWSEYSDVSLLPQSQFILSKYTDSNINYNINCIINYYINY